jgi:muramoyltetrapeptide carboxypeptidase
MGLISPASPYQYEVPNPEQYITDLVGFMEGKWQLSVKFGPHMNETYGYLAGPDRDRAADVNAFFADKNVSYILANRGGYGCDRILDLIDYEMIKQNPKIIMGYSDLTALITAIYFKTGIVTFYGPMGIDNWYNLNEEYARRVIFNGEAVLMKNPPGYNVTTIVPGKAKGRLLGGNLSVFVSLLGSEYIPADTTWENVILFLEDVGEAPYRIDRMLASLNLSRVIPRLAGFVWGICKTCEPDTNDPKKEFHVKQVLDQYFKNQKYPSYSGAMFGHIDQQFTIPLGISAELDATAGTIQLLETAVL